MFANTIHNHKDIFIINADDYAYNTQMDKGIIVTFPPIQRSPCRPPNTSLKMLSLRSSVVSNTSTGRTSATVLRFPLLGWRHEQEDYHHCWPERCWENDLRPFVSPGRGSMHALHQCGLDCGRVITFCSGGRGTQGGAFDARRNRWLCAEGRELCL